MKPTFTRLAVTLAIFGTTLIVAHDLRAQNQAPARKPMAETSIKLPEYFGLYAVKQDGETVILDKPVERPDDRPSTTLPEDVEFLIYGKDIDPAVIHLLMVPSTQPPPPPQKGQKQFSWDDWMQQTQVDGPANFMASLTGVPRGSKEGKLLVKPVSSQPQMLRMIPAMTLPNGVYQIGTPEKTWYRFVVGPIELPPISWTTSGLN